LDLLRTIAEKNSLFVSITITTLKVNLARLLEPRAPRPVLRLEAVRELNRSGVPAGVNCAPVLPGITDGPADLEALVRATAEAGGRHIFADPLFLKPCSAAVFLPFLEKEFPDLVSSYHERYKDRAYLPKTYQQRISQLIARFRQKYGIHKGETRGDRNSELPNPEVQMELF
jgi:DNA repair photolyase